MSVVVVCVYTHVYGWMASVNVRTDHQRALQTDRATPLFANAPTKPFLSPDQATDADGVAGGAAVSAVAVVDAKLLAGAVATPETRRVREASAPR